MSAPTDILTAIETRVGSVLPSYKRLEHSYDLEANSSRVSDGAYGVGSGAANSAEGTLRTLTLDHEFFVILSKKFGGRSGDAADRAALKQIYDDIELLYKDLFQSKLGIPSIVYLVSELSLDTPELIGDNVISVRMNFIVKHRVSTQ
jgi:hypothetical protein